MAGVLQDQTADRMSQARQKASPERTWATKAVTDDDLTKPRISHILTTQDGRLMVADRDNKMVKVASTSCPDTVTSVQLEDSPLCLALLSDGLVALTAWYKALILLDVSAHVTVRSRIRTARQHYGVADGADDVTLIVCCDDDDDGPASVDIIQRDGTYVTTVTDSTTLTGLQKPMWMCVKDGHVLLPDLDHDCVYRVELTTGRLLDMLTHPDLHRPHQVVADDAGNMHVASDGGRCVLVRAPSGQWARLLHGPADSDEGYVHPVSLDLTTAGLVVVWYSDLLTAEVVIGYRLV